MRSVIVIIIAGIIALILGLIVGSQSSASEEIVYICEDNLSFVKYGDPNEIYCG